MPAAPPPSAPRRPGPTTARPSPPLLCGLGAAQRPLRAVAVTLATPASAPLRGLETSFPSDPSLISETCFLSQGRLSQWDRCLSGELRGRCGRSGRPVPGCALGAKPDLRAAAVGARGRGFRARPWLWHSEPPAGWTAVTLPTCAVLLGDSGMWQAMKHRAEDEARGDDATFDHLRNPRLLGKPRIRKASRPAGKISPRAPPVQLSARPRGPGSRGVSYRHPDIEGSRLGRLFTDGNTQMVLPKARLCLLTQGWVAPF